MSEGTKHYIHLISIKRSSSTMLEM